MAIQPDELYPVTFQRGAVHFLPPLSSLMRNGMFHVSHLSDLYGICLLCVMIMAPLGTLADGGMGIAVTGNLMSAHVAEHIKCNRPSFWIEEEQRGNLGEEEQCRSPLSRCVNIATRVRGELLLYQQTGNDFPLHPEFCDRVHELLQRAGGDGSVSRAIHEGSSHVSGFLENLLLRGCGLTVVERRHQLGQLVKQAADALSFLGGG